MSSPTFSPVVVYTSRLVSMYIMLFGLYVIIHGHYSPGGGFQGGAIVAASILLLRVALCEKMHQLHYKHSISVPMACLGVLIYVGIGVAPIFFGGNELDYGVFPLLGMEASDIRSLSILGVEVGVGIAVTAVLVGIYDSLMEVYHD